MTLRALRALQAGRALQVGGAPEPVGVRRARRSSAPSFWHAVYISYCHLRSCNPILSVCSGCGLSCISAQRTHRRVCVTGQQAAFYCRTCHVDRSMDVKHLSTERLGPGPVWTHRTIVFDCTPRPRNTMFAAPPQTRGPFGPERALSGLEGPLGPEGPFRTRRVRPGPRIPAVTSCPPDALLSVSGPRWLEPCHALRWRLW